MTTQGVLDITTSQSSGSTDPADTYLRLFDDEGKQLASNDDDPNRIGHMSRISEVLQPGTYYAGVSGWGNHTIPIVL